MEKRYIGDGVYASFDGYQIWLTTERDGRTHSIALEAETFDALIQYQKDLAELTRKAFGDQT